MIGKITSEGFDIVNKKKNVMILFGGQSNEHEVSVLSARNVLENADKEKFDVIAVGITREGKWMLFDGEYDHMVAGLWEEHVKMPDSAGRLVQSPRDFILSFADRAGLDSIDAIFPVMHGINAEDGTMQGLLELTGIPYVGPGVLGSSMGMDKEISKVIFEKAGIPQCKYLVAKRHQLNDDAFVQQLLEDTATTIGYPCFIKPANAGSSVGVHKVDSEGNLLSALKDAAKYDSKILIEEFINGREVECAVLGNNNAKASVLGEIISSNEFYDYNAKYIDNKSQCVIPADLTGETAEAIKNYAVKAFESLQCSGLSRVDFFVENDTAEVYINEINTLPGFTSISMYPMLWGASGINYADLITKLFDLAIERHAENDRKLVSD